MRETDVPFVAQSWLKTYAPAHAMVKRSDYLDKHNRRLGSQLRHAYFVDHAPRVERWMRRGVVLVACLEADDEVIAGWVCGEHDVTSDVTALHFCYVKSGYRKAGVGKALVTGLLEQLGRRDVVITHLTPMAQKTRATRTWPHVPWLAFTAGDRDATQANRPSERRLSAGAGR